MKERPIIFSSAMVRAILDGRKTQTRRVVKPQPRSVFMAKMDTGGSHPFDGHKPIVCPYGVPGDRLWVRETWRRIPLGGAPGGQTIYRATEPDEMGRWKPSIHLPRKYSRILLEIESVRVERVQEISEEDAKAEGSCVRHGYANGCDPGPGARSCFNTAWGSIYGPESWDANPWVWVIGFRVVKGLKNLPPDVEPGYKAGAES